MLENKNSEAGFREQFELHYLRLKEEEERIKKNTSIEKHKKNFESMGNNRDKLRAYA